MRFLRPYSLLILITFATCGFSQNLPKGSWKIVAFDTEERHAEVTGTGPATCLIDGNINTYWTSEFKRRIAPLPHYIIVDLSGTVDLQGFRFYPRQNWHIGKISDFRIYASLDNRKWELIHQGRFTYKDIYDFSPHKVTLSHHYKSRYVKLELLSKAVKTDACMHLAEMDIRGVYTSPFAEPRIHVIHDTIYKNEAAQLADSSYALHTQVRSREWHFPGGNPSVSHQQNPVVRYEKYGTYSANLTLTTKDGIKRTTTLPNAVIYLPGKSIPRSSWKLAVSEQEILYAKDSAGNMTDNKPATLWHTYYYSNEKKSPHFILIDLGTETKICGIGYLPRQEGGINGIFSSYRIFVSNSTSNFGKEVCRVTEPKPYRTLRITEFPPITGRYLKIVIDKAFPAGKNFASASEIYIYENTRKQPVFAWVITALIFLIIFATWLIYKSRKQKKSQTNEQQPAEEPVVKKNVRLYLFGKFRVQNNDSDVEQLFKKIKQLLAIITYYTIDSAGISSTDLSRLLWAELPEENVANARNSNVKKLRTVLQDIPEIQIVIENKRWKIQWVESTVYIDFVAYCQLTDKLMQNLKNNLYNHPLINNYLSIIERGRFLEDIDTDWADDLKNKISEKIIDLLKNLLSSYSGQLSNKEKIRICDCLFQQDELNTDALRMKLQVYCEDSNLGLAKKTYDAYSRKYRMIYNEDFPINFTELT